MPNEHSPISPSQLAHYVACPNSWRLIEALRNLGILPKRNQQVQSPAAAEGTRLHKLMENNTPSQDPLVLAARQMRDDLFKLYQCEGRHQSEVKVHVTDTIQGTCDSLWYDADGDLHITDYKFGFIPVRVKHNLQLCCYAYACIPKLDKKSCIFLHIIQPRVSSTSSTWATDPTEVSMIVEGALKRLNDNEYSIGRQCVYCDALPYCPHLLSETQEFVNILDTQTLSGLSINRMFDLYPRLAAIKAACGYIEKCVMANLATNGPSHNLALERTAGRREWNQDHINDIITLLNDEPQVEAFKSQLLSPRQILGQLSKSSPTYQKLQDYIQMSEGKSMKIVSAS